MGGGSVRDLEGACGGFARGYFMLEKDELLYFVVGQNGGSACLGVRFMTCF